MVYNRALTSNSASFLPHLVSWSQEYLKRSFEVPLAAGHLPVSCLFLYGLELVLPQKQPTYKTIQ